MTDEQIARMLAWDELEGVKHTPSGPYLMIHEDGTSHLTDRLFHPNFDMVEYVVDLRAGRYVSHAQWQDPLSLSPWWQSVKDLSIPHHGFDSNTRATIAYLQSVQTTQS